MSERLAALYARVSSDHQAEAHAIQSQVAALRAHLAERGVVVPPERAFLDEGDSGAARVRPALERLRDLLERLRDLAAAGGLDELYVHAPDRLARQDAYQVRRLEEVARAGVRVVFLTRPHGARPEDDLLLPVQGMVAAYERARFLARRRRGKRPAAQGGAVSVLTGAPYGYRVAGKRDGAGQGRYEVVLEEARVVRQIFAWVGQERRSLAEVARRLTRAGVPTRSRQPRWDPSGGWGMLKNPAYAGRAASGKTRAGPWQPPLRPRRGQAGPPRQAVSVRSVPPAEWVPLPVPALVSEALFAAAQEQLAENRRRARRSPHGVRYLLQGLLVCARCGYAYYGKTLRLGAGTPAPREPVSYRCSGTDRYRFGGTPICDNAQLRGDQVDPAVWQTVCGALEQPERVAQECRRRLATLAPATDEATTQVAGQVAKLRQGLARRIASYADGLLEQEEFELRVRRLRERIAHLEEEARRQADEARLQRELTRVIGRVEVFAARGGARLADADGQQRRESIQALVQRGEVERDQVTVIFRIGMLPPAEAPPGDAWQDRLRAVLAPGLHSPGG